MQDLLTVWGKMSVQIDLFVRSTIHINEHNRRHCVVVITNNHYVQVHRLSWVY